MFLTAPDYRPQIKDQIMNQVIEQDITITAQAETQAQAEMESYLNQLFDTTAIFAATGAARNAEVVMRMIDIVLYHIHSRIRPMDIPTIRVDRYTNAKLWLEMVRKGELSPNLPKKKDADDADSVSFRFGSNDKLTHQY